MQKNLKLNKSMAYETNKNELQEILKVVAKLFTKSLDVI